jgi:hypothetical protein
MLSDVIAALETTGVSRNTIRMLQKLTSEAKKNTKKSGCKLL